MKKTNKCLFQFLFLILNFNIFKNISNFQKYSF